MLGGTARISQIVQHVKEGDEIEIFRAILFNRGNLEACVRNAMFPGMCSGLLERAGMKIVSNEVGFGKSVCHEHGRKPCSASDVGDRGPALQLGRDSVERGKPVGYDVRCV